MRKVNDVVIVVKNMKNGKEKTIHTDRVRVVHEEAISSLENMNARKAYPVQREEAQCSACYAIDEDTEDMHEVYLSGSSDSGSEQEDTAARDNIADDDDIGNADRNAAIAHPYALRSRGETADLPLVMTRPLEHQRRL